MLFKNTTPIITQAVELERLYPDNVEIQYLLAFMRESTNGKFGRANENTRGKMAWDEDDEPPPHASGH